MERVHLYVPAMPPDRAVARAVEECTHEGILADFLQKHRAEAIEVCIFEYDEERELEKLRRDEREIGYDAGHSDGYASGREDGRNEGRNEGWTAGQMNKLISLVCKKLRRGKSPEQIAEELEEDADTIRRICEAAAAFAPEYDSEKVYELMAGNLAGQI